MVVKKEQVNTSEKVEKKRKIISETSNKNVSVLNTETETAKEEILSPIIPDMETKNDNNNNKKDDSKEELSSIQIDKPLLEEINLEKIFELKLGAEFLDGHLKVQTEATKIQRRSEENYHVFGQILQGAPFDITFECLDREEADILWNELIDYEKTPEKYIKEVPKTEQSSTKAETQPATPIEPQKKPEDFIGVPLSTVDMDSLINAMPETKSQNQPSTNINPIKNLATPTNISHLINNQNTAQMESYGQSIADHINTSFQANIWGAMPLDAAKMFLSSCSNQYKYEFKKDDKGYFMELTKDETTVRIPKNLDEYLKVS